MKNKIAILKIKLLICFLSVNAYADNCPPPPSSINPVFTSNVVFDKKTQVYRYQYTVKNNSSSRLPINIFGLLVNQAPNSSKSPLNWIGDFTALAATPSNFSWGTYAIKESDANKSNLDTSVPAPVYAIQPGKSLSGFELLSSNPPGVVQFFAEGFTQAPSVKPTADNPEPDVNCPEWDFDSPMIDTQVTGATVGPSDPSIISIKIRAREVSGLRSCGPINPKKPNDKISILVLSTSSFDASQIDLEKVMFGPGNAAPLTSKFVPTGIGEDIGKDERLDWEKSSESASSESADKKKKSNLKNLLLTFDVASLDVQCNLDQSLFLRGKTKTGQMFAGAITANVAGCGEKEIGKHTKRRKMPFKWWDHKREKHGEKVRR